MNGLCIDDDVDEGVQIVDGTGVAYFWAFDAECFGWTVDAFAGGALAIDALVKRTGAVQGDTHLASQFVIDIFGIAQPLRNWAWSYVAPVVSGTRKGHR